MGKAFVKRPRGPRRGEQLAALLATADNGKAISMKYVGGPYHYRAAQLGLRMRSKRQKDGTFLAWCERVKA